MKKTFWKFFTGVAGILLILMMTVSVIPAQNYNSKEMREQRNDGRDEVRDSVQVFNEIMSKPDKAIPRELLENATAIGIFPNVVKAAFIVGGRGGSGIVARRDANGNWMNPVFYDLSGGSFGLQIGAKSTDYIMLFMNEGALRELEDDKLEFGGNVSFAAGPVGRTAGAATNATLDSGILTWSRSKGAFIGASLKGAVITADNSINNAFYGMNGGQVLKSASMPMAKSDPAVFSELKNTLTRYGGTHTTNEESAAVNGRYRNTNMNMAVRYDPYANSPMAGTRTLARKVRNELLTLPYYSVFDWIEFEVAHDGTVYLWGNVTTPPDTRSRAAAYVRDIPGVKNVVNDIETLPVSPNDDRLRRSLYREIYSGPLFRYQVGSLQSIHIVVENGRVTLKGVVDSRSDKNLAGIRARSVPGVFKVTNELEVNDFRKAA